MITKENQLITGKENGPNHSKENNGDPPKRAIREAKAIRKDQEKENQVRFATATETRAKAAGVNKSV